MDRKAAEKKGRLLQALDRGLAMIHLDARRPGVLVPASLRGEAHLRLNLSYRFDPPDLSVGDWGVRCTLSFSGSRFNVAVPWSALFAVTCHTTKEFWIYPDDMPEELVRQTAAPPDEARGPPRRNGEARSTPRALLREVVSSPDPVPLPRAQGKGDPGAEAADPPPEGPRDDPPRPRGRAHLRVVK